MYVGQTFQVDENGVLQAQTSTLSAADVNIASGTVGIDQSITGDTNGVTLQPSNGALTRASNSTTTAYAASLIVKAFPGKLYGLSGYNSKGSAQFVQIFDSATLPADGVAPKVVFTVAASANFSVDFGTIGRSFGAGIVVCNSSTGSTKTIGAADLFIDAQYV